MQHLTASGKFWQPFAPEDEATCWPEHEDTHWPDLPLYVHGP